MEEVSSYAHAVERKHCSTQHDSALLECEKRKVEVCFQVVFKYLYFRNILLVMLDPMVH